MVGHELPDIRADASAKNTWIDFPHFPADRDNEILQDSAATVTPTEAGVTSNSVATSIYVVMNTRPLRRRTTQTSSTSSTATATTTTTLKPRIKFPTRRTISGTEPSHGLPATTTWTATTTFPTAAPTITTALPDITKTGQVITTYFPTVTPNAATTGATVTAETATSTAETLTTIAEFATTTAETVTRTAERSTTAAGFTTTIILPEAVFEPKVNEIDFYDSEIQKTPTTFSPNFEIPTTLATLKKVATTTEDLSAIEPLPTSLPSMMPDLKEGDEAYYYDDEEEEFLNDVEYEDEGYDTENGKREATTTSNEDTTQASNATKSDVLSTTMMMTNSDVKTDKLKLTSETTQEILEALPSIRMTTAFRTSQTSPEASQNDDDDTTTLEQLNPRTTVETTIPDVSRTTPEPIPTSFETTNDVVDPVTLQRLSLKMPEMTTMSIPNDDLNELEQGRTGSSLAATKPIFESTTLGPPTTAWPPATTHSIDFEDKAATKYVEFDGSDMFGARPRPSTPSIYFETSFKTGFQAGPDTTETNFVLFESNSENEIDFSRAEENFDGVSTTSTQTDVGKTSHNSDIKMSSMSFEPAHLYSSDADQFEVNVSVRPENTTSPVEPRINYGYDVDYSDAGHRGDRHDYSPNNRGVTVPYYFIDIRDQLVEKLYDKASRDKALGKYNSKTEATAEKLEHDLNLGRIVFDNKTVHAAKGDENAKVYGFKIVEEFEAKKTEPLQVKNENVYSYKVLDKESQRTTTAPSTTSAAASSTTVAASSPLPRFTYALKPVSEPSTVVPTVQPKLLNPTTTTAELKHTQLNSYRQHLLHSMKQVASTTEPNFGLKPKPEKLTNSGVEKEEIFTVPPKLFHSTARPAKPSDIEDPKHTRFYSYKFVEQEDSMETSTEKPLPKFTFALNKESEFEKLISAPPPNHKVNPFLLPSTAPITSSTTSTTTTPSTTEEKHVKLYNYKLIEQEKELLHPTERPLLRKFNTALKNEDIATTTEAAADEIDFKQNEQKLEKLLDDSAAGVKSEKLVDVVTSTQSSLPHFTYGLKEGPAGKGVSLMQESESTKNYFDSTRPDKTAESMQPHDKHQNFYSYKLLQPGSTQHPPVSTLADAAGLHDSRFLNPFGRATSRTGDGNFDHFPTAHLQLTSPVPVYTPVKHTFSHGLDKHEATRDQ